jgi:hypothetical protein
VPLPNDTGQVDENARAAPQSPHSSLSLTRCLWVAGVFSFWPQPVYSKKGKCTKTARVGNGEKAIL